MALGGGAARLGDPAGGLRGGLSGGRRSGTGFGAVHFIASADRSGIEIAET